MMKSEYWQWFIHYNLVLFVHSFDSICQLPGTPVCEASDTKYSGDEVENLILPDYDSCAIFCLWNPDCNGLSFLSTADTCILFSKVIDCKLKKNGWISAVDCFQSKTGRFYEWKLADLDDFKIGLDGSLAVAEGSNISLTCDIPDLDSILVRNNSVRWMKRDNIEQTKTTLEETSRVLQLSPVTKQNAGLYSCELTFFEQLVLSSPEISFKVLYLENIFPEYPKDVKYSSSDTYIILKCTAPDSYPKAMINWYKETVSKDASGNSRPVSRSIWKESGLEYVFIENNFVIINPSKGNADGTYKCSATNEWLDKKVSTPPVQVSLDPDNGSSVPQTIDKLKSIGDLQKLLNGDIEAKKIAKYGKAGVWSEEEMAFRCISLENIGTAVTWKWDVTDDGSIIKEVEGLQYMEGNQAIMFSPWKIQKLRESGITSLSCSGKKDIIMELPLISTIIADNTFEKTVMLNLNMDADDVLNRLRDLFQSHVRQDQVVVAKLKNPSMNSINPISSLNYIAFNVAARYCPDYDYLTLKKDIRFSNSLLGTKLQKYCPTGGSVTGKCLLTSPSEVSWIFWMTSDCNLNQIIYTHLQSLKVSSDANEKAAFEIDENSLRTVSIETLNNALQNNTNYYADEPLLSTVILILKNIKESPNVSDISKKRSDLLLRHYMTFLQSSEGLISFTDDDVSSFLWTVKFPLQDDAKMSFSSSGVTNDFSINLPVGLNTLMEGSQTFYLSLYHQPETFSVMEGQAEYYLSKLVDIDPPQLLSNLSTEQEITIGLGISDIIREDQEPMCYWYDSTDSTWKTDGVTTLGFNDGDLFECQTNHLTAFSVLVSPTTLSFDHEEILTYLTYVGGGLSCLALLLTIVALVPFREIRRSNTTKIHICLAATLLLATLLFLFGIDRTEIADFCTVISMTLHFLWLTAFTWTVVEAYNLYLLFIRILTSHGSSFIFKLGVPAVTIPGIIVGITAGLSFESYTHRNYCFLSGNVVYYAFLGPLGVAFIINCGVFAAVIYKIFKKAKYQNFESKAQKVMSQMKAISTLSCVLGLTWVFGFLTFDHRGSIVFHYLFVIFNTLQGAVIFFCHCVIKPDVRQKWLFVICSIGSDPMSGRTSRMTTPSKSRFNLLHGMFQKRGSTATLSTQITKLSLTKQLTRQRTDSSLALGMMHANALMKKVSLEPVEEKESVAKEPLRPMLSSHSSADAPCSDLSANILPLTPPAGEKAFSFEPRSSDNRNTAYPHKRLLPMKIQAMDTSIRNVLAEYIESTSPGANIDRKNASVIIDKQKLKRTNLGGANPRQIPTLPDSVLKQQNLEDRLMLDKTRELGETESRASSSNSATRSISPLDARSRRRISPSPPKILNPSYDAGVRRADMTLNNFEINVFKDDKSNHFNDPPHSKTRQPYRNSHENGPDIGKMYPPDGANKERYSLELDSSEIAGKLADLKEWDWAC